MLAREEEYKKLDKSFKAKEAQLIVVYGRLGVGKTYLINNYFNNEFAFKITGAYNQPKSIQLRNFNAELNRRSNKKWKVAKDWIEAF